MTAPDDLRPIRQDAYVEHSSPSGTSTAHYPLGRWIVNFTNELGRQIHVAVINRKPDAVKIVMHGPTSGSTNSITRKEAVALRNALNAALQDQPEVS